MSNEAKDYESIWCPKCRYQFRQISDSDDQHIRELEAENERLREALNTAFDCYAAQIPTPTAKIEAAQKLILWNRERALAAIKEKSDEHQQSVSD